MGEEKKAYDIKALVAKLEARGISVGEDVAKGAIEDVFAWLEESIRLSPNPLDDIALVVLPKVKEFALAQADKIDGQVG